MSKSSNPIPRNKLALAKRTLRQLTLSDAELAQVAGGASRTRPTTI